tara:strand:- start:741 stop:941 length:201 start_codon:yes stop_codon:yes gene_type:complete
MGQPQGREDFVIDKATRLLVTVDRGFYTMFDDGQMYQGIDGLSILTFIQEHYGKYEALRFMDWFKL